MTAKEQLLARVADRSALIGVFGLGYVGLPLTLRFSQAGFYDADGNDAGAAVQFAQLSGAPALDAADIAVIA